MSNRSPAGTRAIEEHIAFTLMVDFSKSLRGFKG